MTKTDRYKRQLLLPEIGDEGQKKINEASILCIGAGGLGCPALLYLAAAGIGRIGIIDFDKVDESNLQRQVIYTSGLVGMPKAESAAAQLSKLNPDIQIEYYNEALTAQNVETLFQNYDLILDGTDNFETKFLINDASIKFGKPWIYGAIQGFDGQVSVFNYKGGPCYRCLYPEKPKGYIMNCAEAGVIGAVAGIIGVTQALQAIQVITQHESFTPLAGELWVIDTHAMDTRTLKLEKNATCPVCSKSTAEIILNYSSPVCAIIPEITIHEFRKMTNTILIDVREQEEWDRGNIPGAQLWPLSKIKSGDIPDIPKETSIILHCQKGMRSIQAAQILKTHGYTSVVSLTGGYEAWVSNS